MKTKKRKLKKHFKIIFTILIIIIDIILYKNSGYLKNEILLILNWLWLFFIQFILLYLIYDN